MTKYIKYILPIIVLIIIGALFFNMRDKKKEAKTTREQLYHGTSSGSLEDFYNLSRQISTPQSAPSSLDMSEALLLKTGGNHINGETNISVISSP